jgi:hypothetical protein
MRHSAGEDRSARPEQLAYPRRGLHGRNVPIVLLAVAIVSSMR